MEILIELPGVKLGVVEADEVTVVLVNEALARQMDEVCERKRGELTMEGLAELEAVRGVRRMFRGWGMDPSKYRPSSEALLRRVVQGKGLYNISNIVDLTNLGSIETAWPYGVYNREAISGEIALRLGAAGEKYEGIGRRVWHLEGRPVLADADGPFGSPISDSTRTQVRDGVSQVLTVIYAPAGAAVGEVEQSVQKQAHRLKFHAEAQAVRTNLIQPIT